MERDNLGLFLDIPRSAYEYMVKKTAKNIDQAISELTEC